MLHDEPMARHVTWAAGGRAKHAYRPADTADLACFLGTVRADEPILMVGLGSNLLVRDGGFAGTVIFTHPALCGLRRMEDGSVYAEAGLASPKLARFAATHDLAGAEFLAGIPGTVGGALAMNAGCYGAQTWERIERVATVDRGGRLRERAVEDFAIGYRHCGSRVATDEWFVGAWFRFEPGSGAEARSRIRSLLERRVASQPLRLPNAGSVFRNPPGANAAQLIEAAGLKGLAVGGARVSEMHANFITNDERKASAADIESLIEKVRSAVREKFGIELLCEVRIVGERVA
ncbi:MAG: UDP-N-acetylmuramate dehydrogenase [Rhodocyclaceae bacterium]